MGKLWYQPNKNVSGNKNPNWKGGKQKLICMVCKEVYFKFQSQNPDGRSKYCSKRCFYLRHPHNPTRDSRGYIWLFKPTHPNCVSNGYIKEHRYVIEKKIGRYLTKSEVVHHINGIRADNRIGNLRLFSTHSAHMKHHHSS